MNFGEAIEKMKAGEAVARGGWNGKNMWVALQRPDEHSKMGLPYIYMCTVDGLLVPWLASQTDMLAEDWSTVDRAVFGRTARAVVAAAKALAGVVLALLFVVALAPAIALAQAAAPAAPAPTIGQQLLGLIGSSGGIATIVTLVGGVLAMAFGSNVVLKRRIALAAYHAFHVTEDIANEDTSENGIDKAAVALKQIDAYFAANGWRPMKPGDVELAKLQLQSLSGQEVQAKKLVAAAAKSVSDQSETDDLGSSGK